MSPFRDTVGLVYGEKGDLQIAEEFHILLLGKRLGRNIEHLGMAVQKVFVDLADLLLVEGGIQEMRHAVLAAVAANEVYLILHQRDERAYNDGYPFADNSRQLIAKALAPACRHDHECVLSR